MSPGRLQRGGTGQRCRGTAGPDGFGQGLLLKVASMRRAANPIFGIETASMRFQWASWRPFQVWISSSRPADPCTLRSLENGFGHPCDPKMVLVHYRPPSKTWKPFFLFRLPMNNRGKTGWQGDQNEFKDCVRCRHRQGRECGLEEQGACGPCKIGSVRL